MITIVLNVSMVIMENICGETHVMRRIGAQILTQRAYVVMNINASRAVKILESALTIPTVPLLDNVQRKTLLFWLLTVFLQNTTDFKHS